MGFPYCHLYFGISCNTCPEPGICGLLETIKRSGDASARIKNRAHFSSSRAFASLASRSSRRL